MNLQCEYARELAACLLCLLLLGGCSDSVEENAESPVVAESSPTVRQLPRKQPAAGRSRATRPRSNSAGQSPFRRRALSSGRRSEAAGAYAGRNEAEAVAQLFGVIGDTMQLGPTVVVWLLDRSPSASELVSQVTGEALRYYGDAASSPAGSELTTAVLGFGEQVEPALAEPTSDPAAVRDAMQMMQTADTSGQEKTFQAIQVALEKYLPLRKQRKNVLLIVVTDEAGDDAELVEQLIAEPRKYGLPIYVIGVPAPLGRVAAIPPTAEGSFGIDTDGNDAPASSAALIRQGPESRHLERLNVAVWGGDMTADLLDSGFGPFALEWLCRDTGGAFVALRPRPDDSPFGTPLSSPWPQRAAIRFDASVMRRYQPDYVSEAEYQQLLEGNKARMALHRASRAPMLEILNYPQTEFVKTSEAELNRRLGEAQQAAARLEPAINSLYDILRQGEPDRAELTQPRWQAGYDLAMGRIMAAKARIDGYNSMLALLKRGREFEHAGSTTWVLEPAPGIETGSVLEKLGQRARQYLERVVAEHGDTPWAYAAQQELKNPMGWRWAEH